MGKPAARKVIFVLALAVFLLSSAVVLKHQIELRIGAKQAEAAVQLAVTPAPQPSPETGNGNAETAAETAPIRVDFAVLLAENPDVTAWLYCPDTPVHYPVVQAKDNQYYLRRLLDGRYNIAGTLFLDYRNAADLSDWNSVIYGHNLNDGSMFGTLQRYKEQAYFEAHPKLYLLTPQQDYVIELVAGFTLPANDELYSAFTPETSDRTALLDAWLQKSDFTSGIVPTPEDRLVTLSTCSYAYDNARYVVIGIVKECGTPH